MKPLRLHAKTTLLVSAITLALFLATLFLVSLRMVNLAREDEKALAGLQALSVAEQISLMTPPRDQDDLDRAVAQARAARPNVIAVRLWEQIGDGLIARASAAEAGASDDVLPREVGKNLTAAPRVRNGSPGTGPLRNFTIRKGEEIHYLVFAP